MRTLHIQKRQRGFSLVELMISMLLGLILLAGVLSVFVGSINTFRTAENLARMQENSRIAFELLARDLREAGGNYCGTRLVANVLNNPTNYWWSDWSNGTIRGYADDESTSARPFGTSSASRVSGTEAVLVMSAIDSNSLRVVDHNATAAQLQVSTTSHGLDDGDIVMVCDNHTGAIFQITNASSSNTTIVHNTGSSESPGNCSKGLGYPSDCSSTNGNSKSFENGGFLSKLEAKFWYIGYNSRKTGTRKSLYRYVYGGSPMEVVENVTDFTVTYLLSVNGVLGTDYVDASSVSDWNNVVAVRMELTIMSGDSLSVDGGNLERNLMQVVSLRVKESIE